MDRRPKELMHGARSPPRETRPLMLYAERKQTYAAVLQSQPRGKAIATSSRNPPPPPVRTEAPRSPSPPHNQARSPSNKVFVSPHSPTHLRFPPSPFFPEWKGHYFRCVWKGHKIAACTYPMKCGKCWKEGHLSIDCRNSLNPRARVYIPKSWKEPGIDDLLVGALPSDLHPLPEGRPKKIYSFVHRDAEYFKQAERLTRAIVLFEPENMERALSLDEVARIIASSNLVTLDQLQVGALQGGRYLVMPPLEVDTKAVMLAIPQSYWDKGYSVQHYTPLYQVAITIPSFKVWIDLAGVGGDPGSKQLWIVPRDR